MQNKSAIVTGGAKRIGKHVAIYLAKNGYDIALHYNTSEKEAIETKIEIESLGCKCKLYKFDFLNDIKKIDTLLDKIFYDFPNCSVLINNSSIFEKNDFLDTDFYFLDRQFKVNFFAPFLLTKAFANKSNKTSNVINMLDSYITKNNSPYFAYLLSKKSLSEFTKMAARQIKPIKVNAIALGIVEDYSDDIDNDFLEYKKQQLPLEKVVNVNDIKESIMYLINSNSITGETIFIDAGEHLL